LSWIGSAQFGGLGLLPYGWDQLCVVIAALLFYWWGLRSGWRTPAVEQAEAIGKVPVDEPELAVAKEPT
jgi:hypothetical protein